MPGARRSGLGTGDGGLPVAGNDPGSGIDRLGPGLEFDLIRSFFVGAREGGARGVRVGPGDDAVVVDGDGIVLSVDLSIEGVHFRREWLDAEEIGYRAAAAALSDLAGMGAEAVGLLASLAVNEADAQSSAAQIMKGVRAAVEGVGGILLGGDLTRSPGPLILDIAAVGRTPAPVLRSGGLPGDELWVTGDLGAAALAVHRFEAGIVPDADARARFAAPRARVRESVWLRERGITRAMLDLSDGIAGDLGHLARASGARAVLDAASLPIHPSVRRAESSGERALTLALSGGEDYEVCFAARPGATAPLTDAFRQEFAVELTRVGHLEAGAGVEVEHPDGTRVAADSLGFQHFRGAS